MTNCTTEKDCMIANSRACIEMSSRRSSIISSFDAIARKIDCEVNAYSKAHSEFSDIEREYLLKRTNLHNQQAVTAAFITAQEAKLTSLSTEIGALKATMTAEKCCDCQEVTLTFAPRSLEAIPPCLDHNAALTRFNTK